MLLPDGSLLVQFTQRFPLKTWTVHDHRGEKSEKSYSFSPVELNHIYGRRILLLGNHVLVSNGAALIKPSNVFGPSLLTFGINSNYGGFPGILVDNGRLGLDGRFTTEDPFKSRADPSEVDPAIWEKFVVLDKELGSDGNSRVVLKTGAHLLSEPTEQDVENARKIEEGAASVTPVVYQTPDDSGTGKVDETTTPPQEQPSEKDAGPKYELPDAGPSELPPTEQPEEVKEEHGNLLDFKKARGGSRYAVEHGLHPRRAGISPFNREHLELKRRRV